MIIVQAELSYESPPQLRKQLRETGFSVYLIDQLTGSIISSLSPIYDSQDDEKIIMLRSGLRYLCIYNGDSMPPRSIIDELFHNEFVIKFVIQKT